MAVRLLHFSDVETAFDDPERVGRLAGALGERRGPDALVAGSGDTTGPSVLSLLTAGAQARPFFERVGVDVDVPGNHDLDHGLAAATELFEATPQTWLAANVRTDGTDLGGLETGTIVEVDGASVGVTGVTTPSLPEITPPASHLTVTDPLPAAADAVADLRAAGADHVVLLAHVREPERFARELDVDAVLAGHVHTEHERVVNGVPVTRPGVRADVAFEVTIGDGAPAVERLAVPEAPVDDAVVGALEDRLAEAGLLETVATAAAPIERTRSAFLGGESRIGNLVADAYRWRGEADVGLQNGAGLRDGPPLDGAVTAGELIGVVPFDADLVVAEVSGAELRAILGEASPHALPSLAADQWNAHWSGVTATWNRGTGAFEELLVGGEPVDPDGRYEVATTEYLLQTDAEFPTLDERHFVRRYDAQYDAIVDYAREVGIDVAVDGRLTFVE